MSLWIWVIIGLTCYFLCLTSILLRLQKLEKEVKRLKEKVEIKDEE